jgi:hypothetical protein
LQYALSAVLSTAINLPSQGRGCASRTNIPFLGLCLGITYGLVTKYRLDKRWIFTDSLMGIRVIRKKIPSMRVLSGDEGNLLGYGI